MGTDLYCHAASNFTHRSQQWQGTVRQLNCFVGNGLNLLAHQRLGQFFLCGEMQVGVEQLIRLEQVVFAGNRFLDLDDHVGLGKDRFVCINDSGASNFVFRCAETAADPGITFDQNGVPMGKIFGDAARGRTDPILPILDLFGNSDNHALATSSS